jgi:methionyl-tRNA synthetase
LRFTVTTPLYYVNALPHVGSAYPTMAADTLARYHRLRGRDVLLVTGTDEHGQKIQQTAEEQGKSPQVHCDEIAPEFERLWQLLNIHYDRFIRTTNPRHELIVKEFFMRVYEKGDIYRDFYEGPYCVQCEEYKDPKELLEGDLCPIHLKPVETNREENYFFALSKYQRTLETYFEQNPGFIQPDIRRNEVLGWVKEGLRDFPISRSSVTWGIPLPVDPAQTIYVWFDALLGYISALLGPDQTPNLDNAIAEWWPVDLHLIGKDILRFHAVYWPAMLLSAGLPLPKKIFGHGYLTKDGRKMGKSLGNTLDPFDLVERYGSDAVRYYFLKELEFGRDGDFAESRFIHTLNADLANDFGNLLNRTLRMASKYCQGIVPAVQTDEDLSALAAQVIEPTAQAYEQLAFSQACESALSLVRRGNKYLDEKAPWTLHKNQDQAGVERVIYCVLESVRIAAILLAPVIPGMSRGVYQQLGFSPETWNQINWEETVWGKLPPGQTLSLGEPLFPRIDP